MDWGREAVTRAYAVAASSYADAFGDEFAAVDGDRRVVEGVLADLRVGSLVLDGGCGPGQVAALVATAGHHPIGVDVTFAMLDVARERSGLADLICADLCLLPLARRSCDAAICWFAVHNLPRTLMPALLRELARVIRPGGRILLATHGGTGEQWFDDDASGRFVCTYYAPPELLGLLAAAGFVDGAAMTRPPRPDEHQVEKLFVSAARP